MARPESAASRDAVRVIPALHRLALALAAIPLAGCPAIPRGATAVDSVRVQGPKFFGLFRGVVYDYELFDRGVLQRDLERVERYYRARGYYEAKARAGRVRYKNPSHVEVTIEVEEGRPVLVRDVRLTGLAGLPEKDAKAVRAALDRSVKRGEPFEEEPFRKAENLLKRTLTARG
jgi:outer membrane protein assembly factor BamA